MTSTYNESRDGARLKLQQDKVRALMSDGNFRTLEEISLMTGAPPASASARLRQLRKEGYEVQREYVRRGLFKYRVLQPHQHHDGCVYGCEEKWLAQLPLIRN